MSLPSLHQLMRLRIEGDWRHYAACTVEDPALFFPRGHTGPWQLVIDDAKAVCDGCPVIEQCLTWALETGEEHGVWGGYDEREIAAIRRRRGRGITKREPAKCGTRPGYKRHHREDTPVCEPCANANRTYMNTRNQTLKEAA